MHACWWLLVPGWITLVFAFEQALVLFPYRLSGVVANGVFDSILGCSHTVFVGGSEAKRYARCRRFWILWRQPSQRILDTVKQPDSLAVAVVDAAPCPADWKGPAVSDPTIQPSCFVSPVPLLVPS